MRWWTLFLLSTALLLAALSLPFFFLERPSAPAPGIPSASPSKQPEPVRYDSYADRNTLFSVLIDGDIHEVSMSEHLPLVVAAEMPAAFAPEALKAQAVASRSYILYKMSHTAPAHPEADVCADPACCKAYASENDLRVKWGRDFSEYYEKIRQAVEETDGEYLVHAGEIIQSVFHASSFGRTEASGNVWSDAPYLVSVSTPETADTVSDLVVTLRVSPAEFAETLSAHGLVLTGEPTSWIGERVFNSAGRVQSVEVGGAPISGKDMRTIFSLRSADFDLVYDGTDFVFTVRGYGHGVGMSQQGANLMAQAGKTCEEILLHYYTGVEIVSPEKSVQRIADDD